MTSVDWGLTADIMAGVGVVVVVLFAVVLTHALGGRRRATRDRARLDRVHGLLTTALEWTDADTGAALRGALRALPSRLWVPLLVELDSGLDGERRYRLARVMAQLGVTERAEQWCRSRRWPRRLRGLRVLTALRAGHTVAPTLVRDPHPDVRALAMEWAADNPSDDLVDELLGLLAAAGDESSFPVKDALTRMGQPAVGPLSRFLERQEGAALEAGLHVVRTAALAGLARLEYWPAAAQVAALLRDPAWPVRCEAALALRSLGPTGTLLLRRALDDAHPRVREVAQHVLDLPLGRPVGVPA